MLVVKRNKSKEEFKIDKVVNAVDRAFKSCSREMPNYLSQMLKSTFEFIDKKEIPIEEIQNVVENILMNDKFFDVAKSYIIYRENHRQIREAAKSKYQFVQRFVKSDNTANATIDDNSNVGTKGIGVLNAEIHKEDNKNTNMYLWEHWMHKLYPDFNTKIMERDFNTILYPHDASSQVMMPYCMAISMYHFLTRGLQDLGGKSAVPKNIDSFCGIYCNLVFALASEVKGAVATPEFLMYMDYFCRKEWGDDYYNKSDVIITSPHCKRQKTIKYQIQQYFQHVTYGINQIAGSRGMQSPFTNFSFFDKYFFEGMFGDFYFPDGTRPIWESTNWLQKLYLHWLNQERLKCILTFPVCSYACLIEDGKFKDEETFDFICEEYAEGNSFFLYTSDSVDSLSSCCFTPETKVLWKSSTKGVQLTTLKELDDLKWEPDKKNLRIFHNGFWIKGKTIKTKNTDFYRVETSNHKVYYMTDNHINVTFDGEKKTKDLKVGDYLMFNTQSLQAIPEKDENLTYEQGFAVGAFLGDGSFGNRFKSGIIYDINYSQNINKYKSCMDYVTKAAQQLGSSNTCSLGSVYNSVYPVRISSKELVAFIQRWTNWTEGTHANNKELNLDCLLQSYEFRKGILDGWYNTDGGNSNKCYTTSTKLKDCMEVLITSLGMNSIIDLSDRTDEKVIIREKEYDRNYPLWCVRWYEPCNKGNMPNIYRWKNNSQYFMVTSIEHIGECPEETYSYCIECYDSSNPYFTLPSGLITHNCRLQNAISDNTFNFTNGQIGVMTGSKNVITLDLNRIIQDWSKCEDESLEADIPSNNALYFKARSNGKGIFLKDYLIRILNRVYMYHTAYNSMLHWAKDSGLFKAYDAGFIDLDKQYLTIGINGLNQAAEFLGMKCNNNEDYKEFCGFIFDTIKEQNSLHKTKHEMFNCEQVPAESAAIKLYNRDKKDKYWVPEDTNLYASYVFKPNDPDISILDKIVLHSSEFASDKLDGGQAAHLNLDSHLSKEQYRKLLTFAAEKGCKYLTFNVPNSECQDCGYITKVPITKCPKCGSIHIDYYDRVIGYLTKIKNWSAGRQNEQKTRVYSKGV